MSGPAGDFDGLGESGGVDSGEMENGRAGNEMNVREVLDFLRGETCDLIGESGGDDNGERENGSARDEMGGRESPGGDALDVNGESGGEDSGDSENGRAADGRYDW